MLYRGLTTVSRKNKKTGYRGQVGVVAWIPESSLRATERSVAIS
ncbi:hypothetical protein REIS_1381 [Rickettsia endosymbiont of Ixodes scapularis]|nr:hypothetical protein REIS_1381 [Rickettsia endosymbiont of Ixodes scapularis]